MAQPYQLITGYDGVKRREDNAVIPNSGGNRDWGEYEVWLAEGNAPDPADPPPDPPAPAPLKLEAHPEDEMDAATKGYIDTTLAARIEPLEAQIADLERRLA